MVKGENYKFVLARLPARRYFAAPKGEGKMEKLNKKVVLGAFVAILCVVGFYFFYWVRTPAYSLNIIREAWAKHDINTFEKHVDLDRVVDKGFDSMLSAYLGKEGKDATDVLVSGIVNLVKPTLVSELKQVIVDRVKGTEAEGEQNKTTEVMRKIGFAKDTGGNISYLTLKDTSVSFQEGDDATVLLKVYDRQVDKIFDVKLLMSQLSDGKWRVKEIGNLGEYFVEYEKEKEKKLAALNAPILEELSKTIVATGGNYALKANGKHFVTYYVECWIDIRNNSDKDIKKAVAKLRVTDAAGNMLKEHYLKNADSDSNIIGPLAKGENTRLTFTEKLNEFNDSDKKIIDADISKCRVALVIEGVRFDDGRVLMKLDKLPDPDAKK